VPLLGAESGRTSGILDPAKTQRAVKKNTTKMNKRRAAVAQWQKKKESKPLFCDITHDAIDVPAIRGTKDAVFVKFRTGSGGKASPTLASDIIRPNAHEVA